jgi:hypothetical protein
MQTTTTRKHRPHGRRVLLGEPDDDAPPAGATSVV